MKHQNIVIRETNSNDFNDIMTVEERAFGNDKEAELTENLLKDETAKPSLSLLAFHEGKAVGHILFTKLYLNDMSDTKTNIQLLAPLAVIPEYQKQGIGGMLIQEAHRILKERGVTEVFVLGHINYYPRYGYLNDAKKYGYETQYPIPEEVKDAWMVQSLKGELTLPKGKIICAKALDREEYWRE